MAITYPTPLDSLGVNYRYIIRFYQVPAITTTLSAGIDATTTTIPLTAGAGFDPNGVLYFPSTNQIMVIVSRSGNNVTVRSRADSTYSCGFPVVPQSAGDTVIFGRLIGYVYPSGGTHRLFEDNAQPGDFCIFYTYYQGYDLLDSVYHSLNTTAQYDSATFSAWTHSYPTSYNKAAGIWTKTVMYDGTKGFTESGTQRYVVNRIDSNIYSLSYQYPCDYAWVLRMEDNGGPYGNFIMVRLDACSNWVRGPIWDVTNTHYYVKILKPQNEASLSFFSLYWWDKVNKYKLVENDDIIGRPLIYNPKCRNVPLIVDISGYSAPGDLLIEALETDMDMFFYMPFRNLSPDGYVERELRQGSDQYMYHTGLWNQYGDKTWGVGRFPGKSAFYSNGYNSSQGIPLYFSEGQRINGQFSVEAWIYLTSNTQGYLITTWATSPFALRLSAGGNLEFIVTWVGGATTTISAPITTGSWHYITATLSHTFMKLYIDSVLVAGPTAASAVGADIGSTSSARLWLFYPYGAGSPNGAIDEFSVWNRELTQTEITARFTASTNQYLQYVSETIPIAADGTYPTSLSVCDILSVSKTGTWDTTIYQTPVNVFFEILNGYRCADSFGLYKCSLIDENNKIFEIGCDSPMGLANLILDGQRTSTDVFRLGGYTTSFGIKRTYGGGILRLWNPYVQGSWYSTLYCLKLYGGVLWVKTNNLGYGYADSDTEFIDLTTGVQLVHGTDTKTLQRCKFTTIQYIYQGHRLYVPNSIVMADPPNNVVTSVGNSAIYGDYHTTVPNHFYGWDLFATLYGIDAGNNGCTVLDVDNKLNGTGRNMSTKTYAGHSIGYSLSLRIVDINGNPIQNAVVEVFDVNGNPVIFLPVLTADGLHIYPSSSVMGKNYDGTLPTSITWSDAGNININDLIRLEAEVVRIDSKVGNITGVTRMMYGTEGMFHSNNVDYVIAEKMYSSYLTDINGYIPRFILYHRQYRSNVDYDTFSPFRIRVSKSGYTTYETKITLTERSTYTIALDPPPPTVHATFLH